jgi:DNA-directed RNA polymerase specialized sigma24 family protein
MVGYVRRMLTSRYRMQPEDVEDLISQTFVDFLQAQPYSGKSGDGLFLLIARRRVADFWRHRKVELSLKAGPSSSPPDREHLESVLLERALIRFVHGSTDLERKRVLEVARAVIAGRSFAEACRDVGIPRGSQGHYRETLGKFLKYLERLRSRGHAPDRRPASEGDTSGRDRPRTQRL